MLIRDLLKTKTAGVEVIGPETRLREAARIACEKQIGSLVVVDGGRPIGIVTERDFLRLVTSGADFERTPVAEIMTRDLIIGLASDDIQHALTTMLDSGIRHLPIMDQGEMKGMLSIRDLVNAFREEREYEIRHLRDYITRRA